VLFTTPPDVVALSLFVGAFWSILTSVSVLIGDCLLAGSALLLTAAARERPVPAACIGIGSSVCQQDAQKTIICHSKAQELRTFAVSAMLARRPKGFELQTASY
jgi:hypothetical protein